MSGFLLDTNLISELVRPKPDSLVIQWLEARDENLLYISVLTLGEISKGVSLLPDSKRRTQLEIWMETDLVLRFTGRVLAVDDRVARLWGLISGRAQASGKTLGVIDGLLAATAQANNLQLVTRNVKDFVGLDIVVFNPWQKS